MEIYANFNCLITYKIHKLDTTQIIYLVAFALILRIVVRLVFKYQKEQKATEESDDQAQASSDSQTLESSVEENEGEGSK